jgi:hypothetical protein
MWFAAKLLFESSVPDDGRVLQEESIRLIQAADEAQAQSKACLLGPSEEHEYLNEHGETVRWRFVSVLEVQDLCEENVCDGMEVFSTLKWRIGSDSDPAPSLIGADNGSHTNRPTARHDG